ncbi:MAG: hypothetical protein SPL59_04910 [Catonella sp.]|nr:hypothetical protein [Catonella sp.]
MMLKEESGSKQARRTLEVLLKITRKKRCLWGDKSFLAEKLGAFKETPDFDREHFVMSTQTFEGPYAILYTE